jgi:hypothetical protein
MWRRVMIWNVDTTILDFYYINVELSVVFKVSSENVKVGLRIEEGI